MKLKICGMKYNTQEVAALQPDYLGFIFYEKSPRNYELEAIPKVSEKTKKVGVFVNETIKNIISNIKKYDLDVIQLHGEESPAYCNDLFSGLQDIFNSNKVALWKVFSIKDSFDFSVLKPYETSISAFLFDTKGKEKGGNGYRFDWSILKEYPSNKPIILSGGIGLEHISEIKKIKTTGLPIKAIDVNSKFEERPGFKKIKELTTLQKALQE
ncbi:phosphoribosylanthranilate isomerase [Patiriisocius hiemis]|uniref:N-(5'-phosphoribosyl)anthranilate isomerase n=1 Tax=Patiriisocius hiemis TaxID=3075604 RepID=A0ABU2YCT5_9FLAO|nr:phosphoribosylanthranilate isomerase [Constantimarinum sp. W242]MDT0555983.1 phosphoribosylanthranilate isomerase [Constantimarinum sp. W242]